MSRFNAENPTQNPLTTVILTIYSFPKRKRTGNSLKQPILNRSEAEDLAIQVLVFLSGDEKRMHRYLDVTGLDPATIRDAASDGNFLASVLDYLMQDEALLLQFCEMQGYDPTTVPAGFALLGGSANATYT